MPCMPSTFKQHRTTHLVCFMQLTLCDFCSTQVAPLAAAFVGYVVFWNLSLQVNSVGFYQLSKIMVLPTVAALEVNYQPVSPPNDSSVLFSCSLQNVGAP